MYLILISILLTVLFVIIYKNLIIKDNFISNQKGGDNLLYIVKLVAIIFGSFIGLGGLLLYFVMASNSKKKPNFKVKKWDISKKPIFEF